jgi:CBS domain containing-hemolysin-like protein
MGIGVELPLIMLAILLNGFFAASEIALVSARISRLASLSSAGAALAMRLKESPETFRDVASFKLSYGRPNGVLDRDRRMMHSWRG